jgi:outer membrane lipoprotein-sorting protein
LNNKFFFLNIVFIYFLSTSISLADLQKNLINKLTGIKTLSFDFEQKISNKKEIGNCVIKYPLLMKCNYQDKKQKTIISNGRTVAIVKKKYKKIYTYPIKITLFSFILEKENIINLIRESEGAKINDDLIEFEFFKKEKNIKIFFDSNSLNLKGWETKDLYSNNVSFLIKNLEFNKQFSDDFFNIPMESDL